MAPLQNAIHAFLFTDIEGSTRLFEHAAEGMARVLDRHDALLRSAVVTHGGTVFKTVGDGFYCIFRDALDAALAAADAQRALCAEPWDAVDPRIGSLRVRMAIHVGPAIERGGDLFGQPLNQTARLLGAGHGGQILASLVATQMVRGRLPEGLTLVDHGHHPLRDLRFSEHIFEIVVDGLPRVQTPLRVADAPTRDNPLIITAPDDMPAAREAPAVAEIIAHLVQDIRDAEGGAVILDETTAHRLARHVPDNLTAYRASRMAEWSLPQYQLDRRFVSLSLLVDLGEESRGRRWLAEPERFDDIAAILAATDHPALVVLGAPGSGKSTLLRHLELTLATRALRGETDVVTWFVPLNQFRLAGEDPDPEAIERWFEARWRDRFPSLPPLREFRRQGRLILLLDGLNEIPHQDAAEFRRLIIAWRHFIHVILSGVPGNRAVFSCRSLDYSAPLSSPTLRVPQVVIEALDGERIQVFLDRYCPQHAASLWDVLRTTPQFESLCTPYLLRMLVDQVEALGEVPRGRAALFTGFVRLALEREITNVNAVLGPNDLLTERDHRQVVQGGPWDTPYALPERGPLFEALSRLAFGIHARTADAEASQVVVDVDTACRLIDRPDGPLVLEIAEALGLLAEVTARDEIVFIHQLLQEYFAARHVARLSDFRPAETEWRADAVAVPLDAAIAELAPADPLPLLPGSGWDEVMVMACPMSPDPNAFVVDLQAVNLPLAGRCIATGEATVSPATRTRVAEALRRRREDPAADLRARIEAGLRLGEVGDPLMQAEQGPHGRFIRPIMVTIPAGRYEVGTDDPAGDAALPRQEIDLRAFALGRFPVTNAEYACFIESGGYEDERWWESDAAQAWRRGEGTGEPARRREEQFYQDFRQDPAQLDRVYQLGYVTQAFYERWQRWSHLSPADLQLEVAGLFPDRVVRQPHRWGEVGFNSPLQPVVGVSWFEAAAYVTWLAAQAGQRYRMSTEVEWEVAARGKACRRFAWGEDFGAANTNSVEVHLRRTSPVGVFPSGVTPEGACDLTGNVHEWTCSAMFGQRAVSSSRPNEPDVLADAGKAEVIGPRVMRGGSWGHDQLGLHAWLRNGELPAAHGDNVGFRIALTLP